MTGPRDRAGRVPGARRLGALAVAAAVAAACGKSQPAGAPRPTSIAPDRGSQAAPVPVRIGGEGFNAEVSADFTSGSIGDVALDARFQALLGETPLEDVALQQGGAIAATVPAGLAPGTYDLTVVAPDGRAGRLAQAYRVLGYGVAAAVTVAAYRVEPVGAQVASRPFTVVVTALDAAGSVVPDFAGSVSVSDLTGTAVPRRVGLFAAGRWTGTVEVRAPHAADVLTVAGAGGATGRSGPFAVVPAPAAAVRFDTPPASALAGRCSGPLSLSLADEFGQPTTAAAATPLAVAPAPAAGVALFSDGSCTVPAAGLTVPAGSGAVVFSFTATAAGPLVLSVTPAALPAAAQTETIVAAGPDRLAFVTGPQTVQAGACSAPVTVEAQDAYGNPVVVSTTAGSPVVLSGADLTFFAGAGCTGGAVAFAPGATTATFSFRRTLPGTGAVDVTAGAGALAPAVQTETVTAGAAARLVFTTAARTVQSGACSEDVTVAVQDGAGNAVTVPSATALGLAGGGLTFHAGSGCAGAGVTQIAMAGGAGTATWSFRGSAAGAVDVTVTAGGLAAATQTETVDPGPLHHFTWAPVASPQAAGTPFAVTVTARDASENVVAAFAGTAALSASPGAVSCTTACSGAATTGAFGAGRWSGTVTVAAAATGLALTAAASGQTGTSNAFDVQGPGAARSPPSASFTATPRVVVSGNGVTFDASASSDRETAAAALEVSWDLEAATAADLASTVAPPATPWTAWATVKTATHAFINNGTSPLLVRPRLAVRDGEAGAGGPDVGYADGLVVVLPHGNDLCTVNTSSLVDDGANACAGPGPDGRLSLTEAVRLANTWPGTLNITFSDPMTIASTAGATLTLTHAARIIGIPGVVLDGVSLDLAADDILVAGLELAHLVAPITVRDQVVSDVQLEDLVVRDGAGVRVTDGHARLRNVRMSGCAGTCVRETGAGAFLGIFASDFQGAGGDVGVTVDSCAAAATGIGSSPYEPWTVTGWSGTGAAFVGSSVFTGFDTAVSLPTAVSCITPVLRFVTFDGNGTGVRRDGSLGASGELTDAIFTRQTAAAVDPLACGLFTLARVAAWGNASTGCLSPDATADPLYIWAAGRDFRLQYASPLKDAGSAATGVELDGAGPGQYLGAGPDRGGRETY